MRIKHQNIPKLFLVATLRYELCDLPNDETT